jgi:hypothetical protein
MLLLVRGGEVQPRKSVANSVVRCGLAALWRFQSRIVSINSLNPRREFYTVVATFGKEKEVGCIVPWLPACGTGWLFHDHVSGTPCVERMLAVGPAESRCWTTAKIRGGREAYGACLFVCCCRRGLLACVPQVWWCGWGWGGYGRGTCGWESVGRAGGTLGMMFSMPSLLGVANVRSPFPLESPFFPFSCTPS